MRGEIAEFALRVDQDDGREVESFLDDLAQGPALARAAAALDEQPAGQQALEVEHERTAAVLADRNGPLVGGRVDRNDCCHDGISWAWPVWPPPTRTPLPFPEP